METRRRVKRSISLCHVQYIIDHQDESTLNIAAKLEISVRTINRLFIKLGIRTLSPRKPRNRPTPENLARWNNYDPKWLVLALDRYGYGDMKYSEALKLCENKTIEEDDECVIHRYNWVFQER